MTRRGRRPRRPWRKCRAAGIRVVMITGDHPHTALAIAREIGIARRRPWPSRASNWTRCPTRNCGSARRKIAVYARVTAEHKLRIIRAWKANDAVVAMTGDGVNDAPAIKGADIGIAMGKAGTEVTKQAADMVITDDNFATIVAAVEEGRGIYDNIRKTLQYLLAGNTGELLLMTVCVVVGLPAPLLPIHLLWINLVTDGLPALCLATDPIDPDVMRRRPRRRSERITDRRFLRTMVSHRPPHGGGGVRGVPLCAEDGNPGSGSHVCVRRAGVRRTPAVLRRSQRDQARLAHPLLHEHQPARRGGGVIRPPGVESAQRDAGPLPEDVLHAARRLLLLLAVGAIPLLVLEGRKMMRQ